MKQYSIKNATVSLCEAFPSDMNGGDAVRIHQVDGLSGMTFDTLDGMMYALSRAIKSDYIRGIQDFTITDVSDGRFTLHKNCLVDINENPPADETKIRKWERGEAFLYNARYFIEILYQDVIPVSESEICRKLGVAKC